MDRAAVQTSPRDVSARQAAGLPGAMAAAAVGGAWGPWGSQAKGVWAL